MNPLSDYLLDLIDEVLNEIKEETKKNWGNNPQNFKPLKHCSMLSIGFKVYIFFGIEKWKI